MITISIIGSGNVAQHLITEFSKHSNLEIIQVCARNPNALRNLIEAKKITSEFENLKKADLYIISISDDAIFEIASKLNIENQLVAHTSGSLSINILGHKNRRGIFYPLQTFSKSKPINFKNIPICLEAENEIDYKILTEVAQTISNSVFNISSEQRKSLHISAVFVSNFVNHLYKIGFDICKENKVPFEIIKPLIQETAQKVMTLSPTEAQTGPAIRNDFKTIQSHLEFLSDENQKKIYTTITQSIQNHGKQL